jgi:pilus assembly protein Flp/PilA
MHYIAAYLQARLTRRDDEGATAVEYGLLVTLIAVAIIAGATAFGGKLGTMFDSVGSKFS